MNATTRLELIDSLEEADRIREQMPAYLEEMEAFVPEDEQTDEPLSYPYLEFYWREADRFAYAITLAGRDCGFVLVRHVRSGTEEPDYFSIAEFFVQPDFRRTGIGEQSAKAALAEFSGLWQIQVLEKNTAALKFWQQVLGQIAGSTLEPEFDGKFFNFWLTT